MKRISYKKNYYVYMHINKSNGKIYVGQTYNLKERWRGHGKNYAPCIKFYRAIQKYGWNNFIHKVVKSNLSREEADELEKFLIEKFDTIKTGYNIKTGGSRGKLSSESLKKMGNSIRKGFKEHPERAEKIRQKALGRKQSKEAIKKSILHNPKTVLIDIDGEIGSIRYWAVKIKMTHPPLVYRKNRYGIDNLIYYIRQKINTGITLV